MSNTQQAVAYSDFVRKLFNRSGDPSKDLAHAILGLATECHEYALAGDRVNAIEELGDTAFYIEGLRQVIEDYHDAPIPMQDVESAVEQEMQIFLVSSKQRELLQDTLVELLDHAKRWVGYGRAPESLVALYSLAVFAQQASRELGLVPHADASPSSIRAVNVAKLLKRYPGGDFDQFRALQRDLDAERATLEAATLG